MKYELAFKNLNKIETLRLITNLTFEKSGIYLLLNSKTFQFYIGSVCGGPDRIIKRLKTHISSKPWLKKDLENWEFYILKSFPSANLNLNNKYSLDSKIRLLEKLYILDLDSHLNLNKIKTTQTYSGRIGVTHSNEIKKLISMKLKDKPEASIETKKKISISLTGKILSDVHKNKIGKSGERPIVLISTDSDKKLYFDSILKTLLFVDISESTLKRRLKDGKSFKDNKGNIIFVKYAEKCDNSRDIIKYCIFKILPNILTSVWCGK